MKTIGVLLKERKKERIKISNLNDFIDALESEGHYINEFNKDKFITMIAEAFNVDKYIIEELCTSLNNDDITYRADNIKGLIDYINKINIFEDKTNELFKKIERMDKLRIDRIEYQREPRIQEDIGDMMIMIEKTAIELSSEINNEEILKLDKLEEEIGSKYLYAKDIELLKNMISFNKEYLSEGYNSETRTKTIDIEIPKVLDYKYIKAKKGSVEYYNYLNTNISRVDRLIRNIDKYIKFNKDEQIYYIHQSKALQDSINIAFAVYNDKEFKAISGSNEIEGYCKSPVIEKSLFKSRKVNKLGMLGIGYDRINDSEKKILEKLSKKIDNKEIEDKGNLTLYTKWEPCPSCYYVINQFREKHPQIDIKIKYIKKYS